MDNITLTKWGNSQGIRISKDILKQLNINDNPNYEEVKFILEIKNNQIILTPEKKKSKLEVLFKDFTEDPKEYKENVDWGESVGNEVW